MGYIIYYLHQNYTLPTPYLHLFLPYNDENITIYAECKFSA